MLRCLIDVSIPLESKCAKCCIHCDEKDTCDYKCCGIEEWGTEEEIAKNCIECFPAVLYGEISEPENSR